MTSRLKDTLLLVGDAPSDRPKLRAIFQDSFNLLEAESLSQAAFLLNQNSDCIAAVLVDLVTMDDRDVALVNEAASWGNDNEIPILSLIHASDNGEREELAFSRGASDVIIKPYTPASIRRRVQVLVDLHLHKWHLQTVVDEQNKTIRCSNQVMLDALSAIIEHRNTESGNHILRIRRFTRILLDEVARNFDEYNLTENTIEIITSAAALHDIGKISIPDAVLNKPGKLTNEEFEVIKTHTTVGAGLIQNLSGMGDTEYLRYAYNIALYHHERWDGKGYPNGLTGDAIPICAQVVGLADVFDALTTPRVYKPAFPSNQAINMILNGECGMFSPKLLVCFKNVRDELVSLAHQYADGYSPKDDTITMPLPGPSRKSGTMNAAQLSLIKYQTILHYTNDTVLELDMDSGLYHVVYNPNPELDSLLSDQSCYDFANILRKVQSHPDDACIIDEIREFLNGEFFRRNLHRKNFSFRIFSPFTGCYQSYELSLLRINTGNDEQHIVIAVLHRLAQFMPVQSPMAKNDLHASPALQGLVSTALRCHPDEALTIDAGAEALFLLTGYTEEEIRKEFDGKLVNMVIPEDRTAFLESMQKTLQDGRHTETEFRILRKQNSPLWVLSKSRFYRESDGSEYIYHAIRDNARSKGMEQEFQATVERNQIIVNQLGGIVFEWNLQSDTMYCSPQWQKRFGYIPISQNYSAQMGIATHFHPDDLPNVRSCIEHLMEHKDSISIEVRISDANAKYLWTKIIAAACLDHDGNLTRIVGILQDIDTIKRAELSLKDKADQDALTGLLNKTSAKQLIDGYLTDRAPESLAAMLVLDLDNFKTINDTCGHLYGDSILIAIADILKKFFRSNDVIARIGGDEYLVFLQDIPSEDMIHSRCRQLLNTIRSYLAGVVPDLNVSCSIGISMVPVHGTGYTDLFLRADEALYNSKSAGKNMHMIYNPGEHHTAILRSNTRAVTRIESDKQPGTADTSIVHDILRRLAESTDILQAIDEVLSYVGELFKVSRVYIFENNQDNTACSNTFEWCGEEITPEKDNLQNISYTTDIPGWSEQFNEQGVFYCTDITKLAPHFRAILEPQGIKSMLQCSICDNGVFRGYVGFDECSVNRLWTQQQIDLLQSLAQILSVFLLKKRTQDYLADELQNMRTILNRQDIWLYVIDPDTCEIQFLNEKLRKLVPESEVGQICYKTFAGRESRCENCPAFHIQCTKNADALIENTGLGLSVHAYASEICWNKKSACLIFCNKREKEF